MSDLRSIVQSFVDQNISVHAFNRRAALLMWNDETGLADDVELALADYDFGVIDTTTLRFRLAAIFGMPCVSIEKGTEAPDGGMIHWSQSYKEEDDSGVG